MSKRSDSLLIEDIVEAIDKIISFTAGLTKEQFLTDKKTVDAVIRNLEVIGEAANRLSEPYKIYKNNVEWDKIVGLRNRIVHEYFGIDLEIIWTIIEKFLPELKNKL